jgi:hypothetical protein
MTMGLLRGVARTAVVAGTASTVAGRVQHRQQNKWNQQAAEQQQAQPPPAPAAAAPAPAPPPAAPSGGGDLVAQLQQLEQLRQQGAITEEEFSAAKARLIGG